MTNRGTSCKVSQDKNSLKSENCNFCGGHGLFNEAKISYSRKIICVRILVTHTHTYPILYTISGVHRTGLNSPDKRNISGRGHQAPKWSILSKQGSRIFKFSGRYGGKGTAFHTLCSWQGNAETTWFLESNSGMPSLRAEYIVWFALVVVIFCLSHFGCWI